MSGARARAERGELAFGTIDCFLVSQLTGGAVHATDVTNASRTLLMNLARARVGPGAAARSFRVPERVLAEDRRQRRGGRAHARASGFLPDGIPIAGIAGDQQAALFGQACFAEGDAKCTYGTGAFALMNIGDRPHPQRARAGHHGRLARRRARPPTRSKGAPSSRARRCSGCATGSASSRAPRTSRRSRAASPRATAWSSFPRSPASAPPTGTRTRAAPSPASRAARRPPTSRAPRSRASPSRCATCSTPWRRTRSGRCARLRVDGGAAANDLLMQFQADIADVVGRAAGRRRVDRARRRHARRASARGSIGVWTMSPACRRCGDPLRAPDVRRGPRAAHLGALARRPRAATRDAPGRAPARRRAGGAEPFQAAPRACDSDEYVLGSNGKASSDVSAQAAADRRGRSRARLAVDRRFQRAWRKGAMSSSTAEERPAAARRVGTGP